MIKKCMIIACIVSIGAVVMWWDARQTPAPIPMAQKDALPLFAAPKIAFSTLSGKKLSSFHDLPEKTVILNFWASWCVPCVAEMPALLRYVQQHQGQVALVAISIDDTQADMQKFIQTMQRKTQGLTQQPHVYWVWDEHKEISLKTFNVLKVPETIVLDEKRRMVQKIVGEVVWKEGHKNTFVPLQ